MPDYVYEDIPGDEVQEFDDNFLIEFERKFGKKVSVFNVHFVHHAPFYRKRVDLTKTSTYGPENEYGHLGREIKVGTKNEATKSQIKKKI